MQDRPSAVELIEAVAQHLSRHVIPVLDDSRLRFRTLVAANVLSIVARELELGEAHLAQEWERLSLMLGRQASSPVDSESKIEQIQAMKRELCRQIEAGAFDDEDAWSRLLAQCLETAREKLEITNPRYLQRVDEAGS